TLSPKPYTLHPKPSTLHPAPSTLNPQPSTLNPTPSNRLTSPPSITRAPLVLVHLLEVSRTLTRVIQSRDEVDPDKLVVSKEVSL
ncbi:hypothetical protein T484DRAFT_1642223, partial [Baffinella frigidus]